MTKQAAWLVALALLVGALRAGVGRDYHPTGLHHRSRP